MKISNDMNYHELFALINILLVHDNDYPEIGQLLLEKGYSSDSIQVLAGINQKHISFDEVKKIINNIYIENNWKEQSFDDSIVILFKYLVNKIIEGTMSPQLACKELFVLYRENGNTKGNDILGEKYGIEELIRDYYQIDDLVDRKKEIAEDVFNNQIKIIEEMIIEDSKEYIRKNP